MEGKKTEYVPSSRPSTLWVADMVLHNQEKVLAEIDISLFSYKVYCSFRKECKQTHRWVEKAEFCF